LVEMAGLHSGPSLALPLRAPEAVQIVPYDLCNPKLWEFTSSIRDIQKKGPIPKYSIEPFSLNWWRWRDLNPRPPILH